MTRKFSGLADNIGIKKESTVDRFVLLELNRLLESDYKLLDDVPRGVLIRVLWAVMTAALMIGGNK